MPLSRERTNVAQWLSLFSTSEEECSSENPRLASRWRSQIDLLQRFQALSQHSRGQQVLDLHRQFAHANARGVINRRRDGSGYSGQADLADASSTKEKS